jgi:NADP-dependent 3-hydroxy acid dehydrogenase YdfG
MSDLKRCVLVTGASSGIGRAVARRLLGLGHEVIGVSRDPQQFQTPHAGFYSMALEMADADQIEVAARHMLTDYPQLDAVVFAAGFGRFGSLEQFSNSQIQDLLQVNLIGQIQLSRALLPHLKQQAHANLIYLGSEAALKGTRQGSVYCASKFALRGFSQALREECGKSSVRVSLINPGMVDTAFFETLSFAPGQQSGQALHAEDIADTVQYILQAGTHVVIDEVNLSPASKVIDFKK